MAKMRVMVVKYGYAVVDADFDGSDFNDAQIVDDNVDFEQEVLNYGIRKDQLRNRSAD